MTIGYIKLFLQQSPCAINCLKKGEVMNKLPLMSPKPPKHQRGAVLIVGLIMLLLMTIVGISAIKGSSLQELMMGNLRDKQIAFQAAEAGLRQGEDAVNTVNPPNTDGSVTGFMEQLDDGSSSSYWRNSYVWFDGSSDYSVETNISLDLTHEAPRYTVEKLDVTYIPGSDGRAVDVVGVQSAPEIMVYRITSRGVGISDNTVMYLQSLFRRQ